MINETNFTDILGYNYSSQFSAQISSGCLVFLSMLLIFVIIVYIVSGLSNLNSNKTGCSKCNKKGSFGFKELKNGELLCSKCLINKSFRCIACKKKFNFVEANIFERDYYCPKCYKRYYRTFADFNFRLSFPESKTFNENPFKEFCGVEIECRNHKKERNCFVRKELAKYGVNQYEDGSLNSGGIEFSTTPANGDDLFNKIRNFCKVLEKRNFFVDNSCGLHAHISTPKDDVQLLKKLIIFYKNFEPLFYKYVSSDRRHSSYCRGIAQKYGKGSEWRDGGMVLPEKILACKDISELKNYLYDGYASESTQHHVGRRYCWCNLHSIFYRGTLEIRSHGGTISPNKIIKWLKIHLKVREYIEKTSFEKILSLAGTKEELFFILKDNSLKRYITKRLNFFSHSFKDEKDFLEPNQGGSR